MLMQAWHFQWSISTLRIGFLFFVFFKTNKTPLFQPCNRNVLCSSSSPLWLVISTHCLENIFICWSFSLNILYDTCLNPLKKQFKFWKCFHNMPTVCKLKETLPNIHSSIFYIDHESHRWPGSYPSSIPMIGMVKPWTGRLSIYCRALIDKHPFTPKDLFLVFN